MRIVILIFLFTLSLISSGCFTYYPSRESPDSVKTEQERYFRILKLQLLDGNSIDVSNSDVKFYKYYKNNKDVFVYTKMDTIQKSSIPDSVRIKSSQKIIPSSEIKSVVVERRKTDAKSTLITAGIIIGIAAILFCITVAIALPNSNIRM